MPTRPTLPVIRWASDAGAIKTVPPGGKQDTGWEAPAGIGEKPILDYENYLDHIQLLWIAYLRDVGMHDWQASFAYVVGDRVIIDPAGPPFTGTKYRIYECIFAHTSNATNFNTDYASGTPKWSEVARAPGDWATGRKYFVGDIVVVDPAGGTLFRVYRCATAHVADADFNVDLIAARWVEVSRFGGDWVSTGRRYVIGELVVNSLRLFRAKLAHTSVGTAPESDPTNWDEISPGSINNSSDVDNTATPTDFDVLLWGIAGAKWKRTDARTRQFFVDELERNIITNPNGAIHNRGSASGVVALVNATMFNDGWIYLSNATTDGSMQYSPLSADDAIAIAKTNVTTAVRIGIVQHVYANQTKVLLGNIASLGFKAKVTDAVGNTTIRAALILWNGASDVPTADPVTSWAGANPTLFNPPPGWNYISVPVDLSPNLSTGFQDYSIEGFTVPATVVGFPVTNVALLIWLSSVTPLTAQTLLLKEMRVNLGAKVLPYSARRFQNEILATGYPSSLTNNPFGQSAGNKAGFQRDMGIGITSGLANFPVNPGTTGGAFGLRHYVPLGGADITTGIPAAYTLIVVPGSAKIPFRVTAVTAVVTASSTTAQNPQNVTLNSTLPNGGSDFNLVSQTIGTSAGNVNNNVVTKHVIIPVFSYNAADGSANIRVISASTTGATVTGTVQFTGLWVD